MDVKKGKDPAPVLGTQMGLLDWHIYAMVLLPPSPLDHVCTLLNYKEMSHIPNQYVLDSVSPNCWHGTLGSTPVSESSGQI